MTKIANTKPLEQYTPEEALEAIVSAPSQYAAETIFRLVSEDTQAALRRAFHAVQSERQA